MPTFKWKLCATQHDNSIDGLSGFDADLRNNGLPSRAEFDQYSSYKEITDTAIIIICLDYKLVLLKETNIYKIYKFVTKAEPDERRLKMGEIMQTGDCFIRMSSGDKVVLTIEDPFSANGIAVVGSMCLPIFRKKNAYFGYKHNNKKGG